jgi:hypothetical protein
MLKTRELRRASGYVTVMAATEPPSVIAGETVHGSVLKPVDHWRQLAAVLAAMVFAGQRNSELPLTTAFVRMPDNPRGAFGATAMLPSALVQPPVTRVRPGSGGRQGEQVGQGCRPTMDAAKVWGLKLQLALCPSTMSSSAGSKGMCCWELQQGVGATALHWTPGSLHQALLCCATPLPLTKPAEVAAKAHNARRPLPGVVCMQRRRQGMLLSVNSSAQWWNKDTQVGFCTRSLEQIAGVAAASAGSW